MRLLLVEDEEALSSVISKGLKKQGYAVDAAYDGEEALILYDVNEYDLIVLDLNIPKIDGIDVLKKIRENDQLTKVLVLSARTKIEDRVIGLDNGANDYLIKPFDFSELEARIRNLLRRAFDQTPVVYRFNNLALDTANKKVLVNENHVFLARKEYAILEYLLLNKNRMVSAEKLIEHVWNNEADPFSNALKYHIYMLKKKLGEAGCPEIIKNVRGQGYIIEER